MEKLIGISKFVIKQFLEKGEQFVYVRRYKTELKDSVPKFFDSINNNMVFPETVLQSHNNEFYCNGQICGYAVQLSTAQNLKSVNFSKVKTIIFDEFGIEEGQRKYYLNNEVFIFLNLVESIARMRDVRIFLLSNSVSRTNPYFLYFNLDIPYNKDIRTYRNGLILVQYMNNQAFRNAKEKTRFGQLVANTSYSDYAIHNKMLNKPTHFIQQKSGNVKFYFNFIVNNITLGVWQDTKHNLMFVSTDYYKNSPFTFSTSLDSHSENTVYIKATKKFKCWKDFIKFYNYGQLRFENEKIYSLCQQLISTLV